jgi:hypothetical protein
MAFHLDRQTYNAVGLSLIMSFSNKYEANIASIWNFRKW